MKPYVASCEQAIWDAGFVRSREVEAWSEENWEITRNTLIVIDYTYNFGEVMKIIAERCRYLPENGPKIRLLVIDHTYPEDLSNDPFWQQFFTSQTDFHLSASNPKSKQKHLFAKSPIKLEPGTGETGLLRHVIAAAANANGNNNYTIEDGLIESAELQLFKMGEGAVNPAAIKHPLFAALMGQAIRNGAKNLENWTRRDLIDNYFSRKHRLPWLEDPQAINKDAELGAWVGAIVTASTLARGAKKSLLEDCLPEEIEPLRVCRRLQLLSRMEHDEQNDEQVFP
ncbi:hypothetical protein [Roseibium album]|uniref:hypothetical protein n=1 Tax=Roseibium album TaxID=311410 RepID=UPI00329A055F